VAVRDLWLHEADSVTRVDHATGEILDRWDVLAPGCPSSDGGRVCVEADGEAAWLTIVDAEWETPVLECIVRFPLDGSTALEAYPVPTGRKPTFVNAVATQAGTSGRSSGRNGVRRTPSATTTTGHWPASAAGPAA
jgi:hypothetical protein